MRFHALLAVNDRASSSEIASRLDAYAEAGFDGVVWQPKGRMAGCYDDAYFSLLTAAILHARSLGLQFGLSDGMGWPISSLATDVARELPAARVRWLALEGAQELNGRLRGGEVRVHERPGVSVFSHTCTQALIERVPELYRSRLVPEAFDAVDVFAPGEMRLADIPVGTLPWPSELEEALGSRGASLSPASLRLLFLGDSEEARALRVAYWECLTDCLVAGLLEPLGAWCRANGIDLAVRLRGEETPWFQVWHTGSALEALSAVAFPGVDTIGREEGNRYFPRLASSAAALSGARRSFCLALGGAGNGSSPEDLERHLRWIGDCGVSDVVLHADQLRLTADAICGWPASVPSHVTWRPVFRSLLGRLRSADQRPRVVRGAETLVVVPMRAIQRRFVPGELAGTIGYDGSGEPNSAAARMSDAIVSLMDDAAELGVSPHLVEERQLERCARVEGDVLAVGSARFRRVVAFAEAYESPRVSVLLMSLERAGVEVLTPEGWLASLGKVTTSFVGMPETLAVGERACEDARATVAPSGAHEAVGPAAFVPPQDPWHMTPPAENLLVLEPAALEPEDTDLEDEEAGPVVGSPADGWPAELTLANGRPVSSIASAARLEAAADALVAQTHFGDDLSDVPLRINLSDPVSLLAWDSVELACHVAEGNYLTANIPAKLCGPGMHELRIIAKDEPRPQIFLAGRFGAWARLWPFDERQMTSSGNFEVYRQENLSELSYDLLESGYPFSFLPVRLDKSFHAEAEGRYRVRLEDVRASAARIRVDGGEPLDVWGPDFETEPLPLVAGEHELSVELYNSTYNVLGPHHYYRGDVSLVTPAQYAGRRNFADPEHAPEHTSVSSWHFVRWGVGEHVALVPSEDGRA